MGTGSKSIKFDGNFVQEVYKHILRYSVYRDIIEVRICLHWVNSIPKNSLMTQTFQSFQFQFHVNSAEAMKSN